MFQRALCRQLSSARSDRFRDHRMLRSTKARAAVERELGRLKNERARAPLCVQALDRVRLHAHPTILAKPASALARGRIACDGRRVQAARRARGLQALAAALRVVAAVSAGTQVTVGKDESSGSASRDRCSSTKPAVSGWRLDPRPTAPSDETERRTTPAAGTAGLRAKR
jgi:hypothetical protein